MYVQFLLQNKYLNGQCFIDFLEGRQNQTTSRCNLAKLPYVSDLVLNWVSY